MEKLGTMNVYNTDNGFLGLKLNRTEENFSLLQTFSHELGHIYDFVKLGDWEYRRVINKEASADYHGFVISTQLGFSENRSGRYLFRRFDE